MAYSAERRSLSQSRKLAFCAFETEGQAGDELRFHEWEKVRQAANCLERTPSRALRRV